MTLTAATYFDNAASTAILPESLEKMQSIHHETYANSSSTHKLGRQAQEILLQSCETLARHFNVPPNHIIFTSGGTESNNLALWGVLGGLLEAFRWLKSGSEGRLISSTVEHPSNAKLFDLLEQMGAPVRRVGIQNNGLLNLDELEEQLNHRTRYLSFHHVQSETGVAQNLSEISRIIRKQQPDAIFHTDAVQSFLKLPLDFETSGADILSISSHKIGGPKGIGALVLGPRFLKRSQPKIGSLIHGSSQQAGIRPGTVPTPLIAGFAAAVEHGIFNFSENTQKLKKLTKYLSENLPATAVLNSNLDTNCAPQTLNFSIPGLSSAVAVEALSARGFCVSAGSACNSANSKPNATLTAMGKSANLALSSIRVSFSPRNTESEINSFLSALDAVLELYLDVEKAQHYHPNRQTDKEPQAIS